MELEDDEPLEAARQYLLLVGRYLEPILAQPG
jgi:hypothetical protein